MERGRESRAERRRHPADFNKSCIGSRGENSGFYCMASEPEPVSAGLSPSDVLRAVALLSSRGARAASVPPL